MARDLFLKTSNRNWARSSVATGLGEEAPPTTTRAGKVMLAGMATTTAIGLIFITSPWWLPMDRQVDSTQDT